MCSYYVVNNKKWWTIILDNENIFQIVKKVAHVTDEQLEFRQTSIIYTLM
jgi:hypothetical protein